MKKRPLPFPEEVDGAPLARIIGPLPITPLAEGVAWTVAFPGGCPVPRSARAGSRENRGNTRPEVRALRGCVTSIFYLRGLSRRRVASALCWYSFNYRTGQMAKDAIASRKERNAMVPEKRWSTSEKDDLLRKAFHDLRPRGTTSDWANSPAPFTQLLNECQELMRLADFSRSVEEYLRARSVLRRSVEMFFTYISMSARADWKDVPPSIRPVTARGWFLGRWLPTFLIIDGPIGRFLNSSESPLSQNIAQKSFTLNSARDLLRNKEFKALRNGFAHWGFDWEVVGNESYVVAYNWENDLPTVKLHQKEADAFHIITFAITEILNDTMINPKLG